MFEFSGQYNPKIPGTPGATSVNRLNHLLLPTVTLVLGGAAFLSRYQRNAMLDVLAATTCAPRGPRACAGVPR